MREQVGGLRAEHDLSTQTAAFLERAQSGVEEFRTSLLNQAQSFVSAIETEFRSVLYGIDAS